MEEGIEHIRMQVKAEITFPSECGEDCAKRMVENSMQKWTVNEGAGGGKRSLGFCWAGFPSFVWRKRSGFLKKGGVKVDGVRMKRMFPWWPGDVIGGLSRRGI